MGAAKRTIICDLDGTIALDHHRNHFLHPKETRNWTAYFDACGSDEPNWPVIKTLKLYFEDHFIIQILTGRSERVKQITLDWLRDHEVPYDHIRMRPEGVYTDDNLMKVGWAHEMGLTPDRVLFVMEDRARVVEAWREAGFTCFQVAPGTF